MAPKYVGFGWSRVHASSSLTDVDLVMRVICAVCGSPSHAVGCDVIGDVKVQRCVGGLLDELSRRHDNLISDMSM